MAKYRLLEAHYIADAYLLGDKETADVLGPEKGAIVGDGTPYPVGEHPTIVMEPLDDEARALLEKERKRLETMGGAMNPVDELPLEMDSYEENYVPGFNVRRRPLSEGKSTDETTKPGSNVADLRQRPGGTGPAAPLRP